MAKRAAPDEQPYRPLLDAGLVSAAIAHVTPKTFGPQGTDTTAVVRTVLPNTTSGSRSDLFRNKEIARGDEMAPLESGPKLREIPKSAVDKFDHEKRILFTRSETQSIDRLVNSLARRLNAQIKVSHMIRALVTLVLNAEGEIDKRAGEASPLVRPPNGDAQALQKFEKEIARILVAAFRDAPPLR
jgi:hypothetical protein